jgi:hypothetical protein
MYLVGASVRACGSVRGVCVRGLRGACMTCVTTKFVALSERVMSDDDATHPVPCR